MKSNTETQQNNSITYAILIDALKYNAINATDTPFLHALQQKGLWGAMIESYAFQTRPSFFAGLWPDESDISTLFWLDPEGSPYRFLRYLPLPNWIMRIPKVRGAVLRGLQLAARRIERKKGHTASAAYAHPAQIPFHLLPNFSYSERYLTYQPHTLPQPTLFDVMRQHKQPWLWLAYPGQDQRTQALLKSFHVNIRPRHRFVYLHFAELDWTGHHYGPDSPQYRMVLAQLDEAARQVYEKLTQMFEHVNGIIFGDHGMVQIQRIIDIEATLKQLDLNMPSDYLYFLDSTQARFWFKAERARDLVIKALGQLEGGRILSEADYDRLHLRYPHNRFGELYYVVEDGTLIYPNFFQRVSPSEGMHGYLPEVRDNWAHYIIDDSGKSGVGELAPIPMVDLFPTMLELLNLPAPKSMHAKSAQQRAAEARA